MKNSISTIGALFNLEVSMFGNIDNVETYLKIFVAIVGAIAAFRKLRESFAPIRRKQELKLDLEILEKLKASNSHHTAEIQKKD